MNVKIILGFVMVFMILICGCLASNKKDNNISDDELYLKNLDDFLYQFNQTFQRGSFSEEMWAADVKILTIVYSNKVDALKVSPEFENSKNSFLQSMTEMGAFADFMMSTTYKKIIEKRNAGEPYSTEEEQLGREADQHSQNMALYFGKALDPNVCSLASSKYENLAASCKWNTQGRVTPSKTPTP
jgi:hypothetical protein